MYMKPPALLVFLLKVIHAKMLWSVLGRLLISRHLQHPWKQQRLAVLDMQAEVFKGLGCIDMGHSCS